MMKKKNLNLRESVHKYQANCSRIGEIAELCEKENRERNPEEEAEYRSLVSANQLLRMRMDAASADNLRESSMMDSDRILRETLSAEKKVTIMLQRDIQTSTALEGTGVIPVAEQEMLKPIRKGLIYDKVGINIRSGLSAGKLRWPTHTKAVAKFADEGERLTDSSIDFSKLEVKPERMGIAIPISREELDSSQGIVESVVREEMPKAIIDLVNGALFTTVGTYKTVEGGTEKTKDKKVVGPFVEALKSVKVFAGEVPTRKELLQMKAAVASGIELLAPCWVMTENMKAELEDVKIDEGSGRFLCENDKVLGYPVFTSAEIGEGFVGFGDWSYQAAGFFGPMNMVVDPYTLARNNATDFVLNGHFATVTLRQEAFSLGCAKSKNPA